MARVAPDRLLSTAEAAELLGISRRTVYRWIALGELPALRLGPAPALLRIRLSDLAARLQPTGKETNG
jgi:excisionase family DNA binding protein